MPITHTAHSNDKSNVSTYAHFSLQRKFKLSANTNSIGGVSYEKGAQTKITKYAVEITTTDGCAGRYVLNWGASPSVYGKMQMLAPMLIGRDAEQHVGIYEDRAKRANSTTWDTAPWILRFGIGRDMR